MSNYEHGSEELTEGQARYYTPTTEQIRKGLLTGYVSDSEFDRWLAEVKAQAWREGWRGAWDGAYAKDNPYRGENK